MLEAAIAKNQPGPTGPAALLQVATEGGIAVMASASLLQSKVIGGVPAGLRARFGPGLSDAQRGLQFVRSAPGVAAALVGMGQTAHVDENLGLRSVPPMTTAAWRAVLQR